MLFIQSRLLEDVLLNSLAEGNRLRMSGLKAKNLLEQSQAGRHVAGGKSRGRFLIQRFGALTRLASVLELCLELTRGNVTWH